MQAQAHSGATTRKGAERTLSAEIARGIGQLREDKDGGDMGWLMGLEPTTTGITIRDSTN